MSRSKVIAITGGYATGKSTVAALFQSLGAELIDLDKLAHQVLLPKHPAFRKIVRCFGRDILEKGKINRVLLGRKVFGNRKALARLNALVHPAVIQEMELLIRRYKKRNRLIVIEVPLLFEVGLKRYFDYIIVVKTSAATQLRRAAQKTGFSTAEIKKRIQSQWPLAKKVQGADFVIDNSDSKKKTAQQVRRFWEGVVSL